MDICTSVNLQSNVYFGTSVCPYIVILHGSSFHQNLVSLQENTIIQLVLGIRSAENPVYNSFIRNYEQCEKMFYIDYNFIINIYL